jgi:8-oxo-dGTP pyrophosphatase MutT (NUDIX family)
MFLFNFSAIKKMFSKDEPKDFTPKFEVVSCFVEYDNKILLLLRQDHKPQGNTYGVPAGKIDAGETPRQAMVREGKEETQITLDNITYIDKFYVRYPDYDFIYHIFHKKFDTQPKVTIHPNEHKTYIRKTPKESLELDLIRDMDECIKLFYKDK